jgi:hypothetical protein
LKAVGSFNDAHGFFLDLVFAEAPGQGETGLKTYKEEKT